MLNVNIKIIKIQKSMDEVNICGRYNRFVDSLAVTMCHWSTSARRTNSGATPTGESYADFAFYVVFNIKINHKIYTYCQTLDGLHALNLFFSYFTYAKYVLLNYSYKNLFCFYYKLLLTRYYCFTWCFTSMLLA